MARSFSRLKDAFMMMKYVKTSLLVLFLFSLSSCVSSKRLLELAGKSWSAGNYVQAIEEAIDSYEKALEKKNKTNDVSTARSFLEQYFPEANIKLSETAEKQLSGSDKEKILAWRTYESLVNLNRTVQNSSAASFLDVQDFSKERDEAKYSAAEILYTQVLAEMEKKKRDSWIEAVKLIVRIEAIIPGFRDVRDLRTLAIESGRVVFAFSNKYVPVRVIEGESPDILLRDGVYDAIREHIILEDNIEFLDFTFVPNMETAMSQGADYFVEFSGDIWARASKTDNYFPRGIIRWQRSYGGNPSLTIIRLSDQYRVYAQAILNMQQSIEVVFIPVINYGKKTLSEDLYTNQFNNVGWMNIQLNNAINALNSMNGRAELFLWAEMDYGLHVHFLETAKVLDSNNDEQDMPIDSYVYHNTQNLLTYRLNTQFLSFGDYPIVDKIEQNVLDKFLNDSDVNRLLRNL